MFYRTKNKESHIARKYDEAVYDNEYVYDLWRIREAYETDDVEYFYDAAETAVVVAVIRDGKCIAVMAYNFTDRVNFNVYKLLQIAYNCFESFEFICLIVNVLSLKWCLRFSMRNKMKVEYRDDLVNFIKEE